MTYPVQRKLYAAIEAGLRAERPVVFVFGETGVGKTSTAVRFYKTFRKGPQTPGTALWRRCDGILDEIMAARFQRDWSERGASMFDRFAQADLAILDEIGTIDPNPERRAALLRLIESRIRKPTVYISNQPIAELAKIYDARIATRLRSGTVIHATGRDLWGVGSKWVEA